MRKIPLILAILLLFLGACTHKTSQPKILGDLPLKMNLAPISEMDVSVSRVEVKISKGSYHNTMNLEIDGNTASGTFFALEPGIYSIDVKIFSGESLIATGQGTGEVKPGQNSIVQITLELEPGSLEIIVSWGSPYENCRRVLMIGNSYTYYNSGVNLHLERLLEAARPEWDIEIQAITGGGMSLQNHYQTPSTLSEIERGNWDLVILQEQSSRPMTDPDLFYQYATLLDGVIQASGALTGFFMTWAYQGYPDMYQPIRDAYLYIGGLLGANVVPVGVAFENANSIAGIPNLYDSDGSHPSIHGSYLAACMFMAKIWNINPMGNQYRPLGMSADTALDLQQLAWTSLD